MFSRICRLIITQHPSTRSLYLSSTKLRQRFRKRTMYEGFVAETLGKVSERFENDFQGQEPDFQLELGHEAHRRRNYYEQKKLRKLTGIKDSTPRQFTWNQTDQIRDLHKGNPEEWNSNHLAQAFGTSPEVIRKILRSKSCPHKQQSEPNINFKQLEQGTQLAPALPQQQQQQVEPSDWFKSFKHERTEDNFYVEYKPEIESELLEHEEDDHFDDFQYSEDENKVDDDLLDDDELFNDNEQVISDNKSLFHNNGNLFIDNPELFKDEDASFDNNDDLFDQHSEDKTLNYSEQLKKDFDEFIKEVDSFKVVSDDKQYFYDNENKFLFKVVGK